MSTDPSVRTAPHSTCRVYEVDGEPIRVRGDEPMDDEAQVMLTEVIRAAKNHFKEETDGH